MFIYQRICIRQIFFLKLRLENVFEVSDTIAIIFFKDWSDEGRIPLSISYWRSYTYTLIESTYWMFFPSWAFISTPIIVSKVKKELFILSNKTLKHIVRFYELMIVTCKNFFWNECI